MNVELAIGLVGIVLALGGLVMECAAEAGTLESAQTAPSRSRLGPERDAVSEPRASASGAQAAVFVGGQDGYHTYRIPALVVSSKGTVLAFAEGRKASAADDGDIDLLLKRSLDQGKTWTAAQVVWAENGPVTIGNPCPVVDGSTGVIWLAFCRNNDRAFVTHSADDGVTWTPPTEITKAVKPDAWGWYATGPGHGLQLRSGRLIIPCDHRIGTDPAMYSHVFFSDDHGGTWKLGGILDKDTDECMAVETADGAVYLNMRNYRGKNRRAVARSQDGGETWSAAALDEALVEPVCQASVVRATDAQGPHILFANPASTKRENLTVRVSYDEGRTWSACKTLYPGPSAYSDLAVAADETIFCLYERGAKHPYETISLARFRLDWLEQ